MRLMIALVLALAIPATGSARWLNYPTAGVPRLANRKPDLGDLAFPAAAARPRGFVQTPGLFLVSAVDTELLDYFCTDNGKDPVNIFGTRSWHRRLYWQNSQRR